MRPLRLPPADLSDRSLPSVSFSDATWYRVHPVSYAPLHFSKNLSHRFSHPQAPWSCLYLGADITTCLWERFGDRLYDERRLLPLSLWQSMSLSEVSIPSLQICDLTCAASRAEINVDLSALLHTDLSVPQAWGKAIQEHPSGLSGIRYPSRFTECPCLVLFEKPGLELKANNLGSLVQCLDAARFLDQNRISLY